MTRMFSRTTRYAVPLLAFSALLLALAAPAAAAPASQQNCGPSLAFLGAESPQALLFGAAPMAKKGDIDDPSAQSPCSAQCGDGSYVTCWGTYCYAYDNNCPSEEGHCYGSSTGTLNCPATCTTCTDSTHCVDKDHTSCTGSRSVSDCTLTQGGCGSCECDGEIWICNY